MFSPMLATFEALVATRARPALPLSFEARAPVIAAMDDGAWQALTTAERRAVQSAASQTRKEKKAADRLRRSRCRPNVIIDLAYDDLMSDRQVASLAQQLLFCHRSSKTSTFTHCLSSFGGRLETRLAGIQGSSVWPESRHRGSFLDVARDSAFDRDKLIAPTYLVSSGGNEL